MSYDEVAAVVASKSFGDMDSTKMETYINAADMLEVFGMDHAAFAALPKWKRDSAKKKHKVF